MSACKSCARAAQDEAEPGEVEAHPIADAALLDARDLRHRERHVPAARAPASCRPLSISSGGGGLEALCLGDGQRLEQSIVVGEGRCGDDERVHPHLERVRESLHLGRARAPHGESSWSGLRGSDHILGGDHWSVAVLNIYPLDAADKCERVLLRRRAGYA